MRKPIGMFLSILLICLFCCALAEERIKEIGPFNEGMAAVQNTDGLWGYIDESGKIVIPCEWEYAGSFRDGIASVRRDQKYGCIDASGHMIIQCEWNRYSPIVFSEGLAAVQNDAGLWGFINTSGTLIVPFEWDDGLTPRFTEGLAAVEKNNMMGYINNLGEVVIPLKYKYCNPFSHGFALVQDDNGFFFINMTGEEAFPEIPRAIQADSFREDGIAFLGFDDNSGIFINTEGQTVCTLSNEYRLRSSFHEGLAGVAKQNEQGEWNGCEGYIDQTGTVVIPLKLFSSYYRFTNGRVCIPDGPVSDKNTCYGIIDSSGTLIYPFTLENVVEFKDTVAAAVQDARFGAISTDGIIIVPFEYDNIQVGDGIILCLKEGKISLFDYSGIKLK